MRIVKWFFRNLPFLAVWLGLLGMIGIAGGLDLGTMDFCTAAISGAGCCMVLAAGVISAQ